MSSETLLAITGNLQTVMDNREKALLTGLRNGNKDSSTLMKNDLRRDIERAGFERRVATTIRDIQYPTRGLTYEPTSLIYSKIPHILSSFADGATIRPNKASRLSIPIAGGPAEKLRQKRGESIIEAFKRRFGEDSLSAITTKRGNVILVARMRATAAGRFTKLNPRKATKTRGAFTPLDRLVTVPVFTLAKQAKQERRLKTRQIMAKGARRHPARLANGVTRALTASERETGISF